MSTEVQRARNREKQKRWQQRHRFLLWEKRQRKKLLSLKVDRRYLRAGFRTFELGDPRDAPDFVPRLVGYCRFEQRPLWSALWALKGASNARWAVWFQELDAAGVATIELQGYSLRFTRINLRLARGLVALRLKAICETATGDPRKPPPWLLNQIRVGGKGQCRCIGRVLPDGTVERFASLREAGRTAKLSTDWINHLAATCSTDASGVTWFDD